MAITVKDIAALAGVSPSTVSRVCNNHPSISKETRERVHKAMAELGYETNPSPSNTQAAHPIRMIGVVLPPSPRKVYENSFYLEAIRGICQFCNTHQVANTVITGRDEEEVLRTVKNLVSSGMLDSLILLYSIQNDPVEEYLCEQGLLYVIIGKPNQLQKQTITIDNDNLLAGREATDYLYSLGHRRIGYLGCESIYTFTFDRKTGYQLSLMQNGITADPDYCLEMDSLLSDGSEELHALLSRKDRPTAFVVSDDILAVSLKRACAQLGLSVPEDVSIVAFNNSLFAKLTSPQLTSVEVNSFQLGYEAVSQAFNHTESGFPE